ncbi:Oxygen-dependent choline dehydrogenase [Gracilariopsis chorda]|uniref:Oxygen-dependent choline dehydrogenase n=1 Tax=Gracilariopsis chorda TaxID=448386 RepID=A0A2V3IQR9_9FLOR|nr:Oxygen-dependent choline dehydrogenase [Gracilariopsis chorda]|eukprot:PXF44461.1 Oxygen-dependent choline dehydrogenase [Gracilariopsis chorda]
MQAFYLALITSALIHLTCAQFTDFLIVGGGTAGCVLASKLCVAFPNAHITILERGLPRSPQSDFLVHAPRKLFDVLGDRSVGEAITSLPDAGINGRTTVALTGATLGGSTTINGMQWTLPLPGTIEQWGVPNLTTASADPYFRRIYNKVGFGPPQNPLQYADDYVSAGVQAGFELNNNPFDTSTLRSIWQTRLSIDSNFRRNDAYSAYLRPLLDNSCAKNVAVVQGATASKIVFTQSTDSNTGATTVRATGVDTVPSPGSTHKAQRYWARREVLVTAGPYNSPKLLQLSGVGTRAVLDAAGVAQVLELPVGEATVGRASGTIPSTYSGVPDEAANNITLVNSPEARQQWEAGLGGILSTPVSAANGRAGTDAYFGCTIVPFVPGPPELRSACYHNTETTGYLRIRDSNPFSAPLLKNNFLSSQADVNRLKRCLENMADVHRQFPASFKMRFKYPPNGVVTEGYVRSVAQWGAHFVGGCAIGDVVTGEFKVKGCSGLRVIDASSIPTMPVSAGPMASVYLLAELMGDRLVEEYKGVLE